MKYKSIACIYVLWHRDSPLSGEYAESISRHFDGLGMERDGVRYRIPVRYRSQPWAYGHSGPPRDIDLSKAESNIIVFLHDGYTASEGEIWNDYLQALRHQIDARGNTDIILPFLRAPNFGVLDAISELQHVRESAWPTMICSSEARKNRMLLHILFGMRTHLRPSGTNDEVLFVSHAKIDGSDVAETIVNYVNNTANDVSLDMFYDATELMPGYKFQADFENKIFNGTLLALVSDAYDSRPWCIYEFTAAKRARRPIIIADIGSVKTSRTYPYGANVPRVRLTSLEPASLEALLVEVLSEGLRCDLFMRDANRVLEQSGLKNGIALPRPPELFDIADRPKFQGTMIYPDPCLGVSEMEVLEKLLSSRHGVFLSPITALKS